MPLAITPYRRRATPVKSPRKKARFIRPCRKDKARMKVTGRFCRHSRSSRSLVEPSHRHLCWPSSPTMSAAYFAIMIAKTADGCPVIAPISMIRHNGQLMRWPCEAVPLSLPSFCVSFRRRLPSCRGGHLRWWRPAAFLKWLSTAWRRGQPPTRQRKNGFCRPSTTYREFIGELMTAFSAVAGAGFRSPCADDRLWRSRFASSCGHSPSSRDATSMRWLGARNIAPAT